MRILKATVSNFGSYKTLSFDYSNQGLALVHGATGSGKSTLQDIPAWVLYGVTSKEGNVDEVRNWNSPGEPTIGEIDVDTNSGVITVTRIRGKGTQNDLYYKEAGQEDYIRGKDLSDTQRILENRLGVSEEGFLASTYFNEFSKTGTFFTAKAKDRRKLLESVAPLHGAVRLGDGLRLASKQCRALFLEVRDALSQARTSVANFSNSLSYCKEQEAKWRKGQDSLIEGVRKKSLSFEKDKVEKVKELNKKYKEFEAQKSSDLERILELLEDLPADLSVEPLNHELVILRAATCNECGGPLESDKIESVYAAIAKTERMISDRARLIKELNRVDSQKNPYYQQAIDEERAINQLEETLTQAVLTPNPMTVQAMRYEHQLIEASNKESLLSAEYSRLQARDERLARLQEVTQALRTEVVKATVSRIQDRTNQTLESFFDAEFRVELTPSGADNLEVSINKNGVECSYNRLSKGQRQLMKLSFATAVMKEAANHIGTHFNVLLLDEALDGLDTNMKMKAFSLLQTLETQHESVLVVDHAPEFQTLFNKRYHVIMQDNISILEEEHE